MFVNELQEALPPPNHRRGLVAWIRQNLFPNWWNGLLTLVLGLFFVGKIDVISALVNFGALTAFLLLHVSVVGYYAVRRRSRNVLLHWVVPVLGFAIIAFVLWNAAAEAKIGGVIWLAIGALVLLYYVRKGTGVLAEHASDPFREAETVPSRDAEAGPVR